MPCFSHVTKLVLSPPPEDVKVDGYLFRHKVKVKATGKREGSGEADGLKYIVCV